MSEKTGQHTLNFKLTNRGPACLLNGYPVVRFSDRSGLIPFRIRHGGDQMITGRGPQPFILRAMGSAVVAVNKYRCDLGNRRVPRSVRLGVAPTQLRSVSLAASPRDMAWCGAGDPGSTVDVTPFEPTLRAAAAASR